MFNEINAKIDTIRTKAEADAIIGEIYAAYAEDRLNGEEVEFLVEMAVDAIPAPKAAPKARKATRKAAVAAKPAEDDFVRPTGGFWELI